MQHLLNNFREYILMFIYSKNIGFCVLRCCLIFVAYIAMVYIWWNKILLEDLDRIINSCKDPDILKTAIGLKAMASFHPKYMWLLAKFIIAVNDSKKRGE